MRGLLWRTDRDDNPVAVYELSGKIPVPKLNTKSSFWIGVFALALFLGGGAASAADPAAKKSTATAKAKPAAPKLYSAERSLTRRAKLAPPRPPRVRPP